MSYRLLIGFFIVNALFSCKSEYKFVINSPQKIQINQELTFSISEKNNKPFDSVQFSLGTDKLESDSNSVTVKVNGYRLGKHTVTAIIFYENKSEKVSKPIYIMADSQPAIYTYKIVNTYPHDKTAYTQGLEYYNGFLYEGTGQKGKSDLRKVALETGTILQKIDLDPKYFGEGITILNNKIHQLTWRGGIGFVYDLETFEKEKEFEYTKSREGWGLTNNGEKLIKSEGSERIWFLNADTHLEENYIEAYTQSQKIEDLNELEYINGKIYANRYQLNSIFIIDPTSGKVEGVADLNSLRNKMQQEQQLDDRDEVLNGIAYDKENNRIFVTGKHWGKLFEIELIKK